MPYVAADDEASREIQDDEFAHVSVGQTTFLRLESLQVRVNSHSGLFVPSLLETPNILWHCHFISWKATAGILWLFLIHALIVAPPHILIGDSRSPHGGRYKTAIYRGWDAGWGV